MSLHDGGAKKVKSVKSDDDDDGVERANILNALNASNVKVSGLKITDLTPSLQNINKHADNMLKSLVMKPCRCEFIIDGAVTAIANGLRRVICSGVEAIRLTFDDADFETTDPFMKLPEFIRTRINSIPILQSVDPRITMKLDYVNTTAVPIDVTTDQIISLGGGCNSGILKKLFDQNICIANISIDKRIKINKIYIDKGTELSHGTFALSCACVCEPVGVEMFNMYTGKGVSSAVAHVTKHKVSFETNGNIDPIELIVKACDAFVAQLEKIRNMLSELTPIDDYYKLVVNGADDTCGNAIVATVCELYPDIPACNYRPDSINNVLTISIRSPNPNDVLTMSIQHCVDTIEEIKRQIVA